MVSSGGEARLVVMDVDKSSALLLLLGRDDGDGVTELTRLLSQRVDVKTG